MTEGFHIVIDFDSTLVKVESLERLAEIALDGRPDKSTVLEKLSGITARGMEGTIPFNRSLEERLGLFSFNKKHLMRLVSDLGKSVTKSVRENRDFIISNKNHIYIISGGFEEYIYPVVEEFGIDKSHVLANKFIFNGGGEVVGFDRLNPLSFNCGKALKIKSMNLKGDVFVLGDGYTDYEIKKMGVPCKFIAFTENVRREPVIEVADHVATNFYEFINIINDGIQRRNRPIHRPAL